MAWQFHKTDNVKVGKKTTTKKNQAPPCGPYADLQEYATGQKQPMRARRRDLALSSLHFTGGFSYGQLPREALERGGSLNKYEIKYLICQNAGICQISAYFYLYACAVDVF